MADRVTFALIVAMLHHRRFTKVHRSSMPVQRSEILAHIQRIAKTDGTPPGRQRFEAVTGIKRHEWYGLFWARWSDALQEAGLSANALQGEFDKAQILEAYLRLLEALGRVPTEGDIRIAKRSDDSFPSHSTLANHLGLKRARLTAALDYASSRPNSAKAVAILQLAVDDLPPEAEAPEEFDAVAPFATGFVYLIKSGKYYKIGKTKSIDRRQYEIGLHLAEGLQPIHSIETDDPSGIEAYWHNRFKEKRMNGEWFNLNASDVRAFRLRKKFM